MPIDVDSVREDFPILSIKNDGKPLVYLDSAATSQKPKKVINAVTRLYRKYNANIHRGVYRISELATGEYENSKKSVAKFVNAAGMEEIVYTRNATEAINIAALSWGEQNIARGDRILITEMEHHSNIIPWQMLAARKGAYLDYVKIDRDSYTLDYASLEEGLAKSPKLVSVTHASNVLGTINDVKSIARKAHEAGAKMLLDAAQSVPHMPVDFRDIDTDFAAFSGHKMLAPSGIGVLYAKRGLLDQMQPVLGGGDMIKTVDYQEFSSNDLPWKFEAGTPNIEGAIGLGAAVKYLKKLGMENVREHEKALTRYALDKLSGIKNVSVFGPEDVEMRAGVVPFEIDGVHAHDIATIFDSEGVAIRAGHHCAMPLVTQVLKRTSLSRMSFYVYNKEEEVDKAVGAVTKVKNKFMIE